MKRDYSYEALAEATTTDMDAGRGELNAALKSIRQQEPDLSDYALADEIHRRAKNYPDVIGDVVLSPSALKKHWRRCAVVPKPSGTNRHGSSECTVCDGHQMVLVATRPSKHAKSPFEEYAPCPECNPVEVKVFRYDGSVFRTPDPGRVREMMNS